MFDKPYDFKYKGSKKETRGNYGIIEHNYTFRCQKTNQRYIVLVEQYDYGIYAVKYYLKNHSSSQNKYKLTTGLGNAGRIIATCLNIIQDIVRSKNPYASFIFIGESSVGEDKVNTKRYRVYVYAIQNRISDIEFQFHELPEYSVYFLLNRQNSQPQEVMDYMEKVFTDLFVN